MKVGFLAVSRPSLIVWTFLLEKKSPAKETSKKINLEVNSKLIFDYV